MIRIFIYLLFNIVVIVGSRIGNLFIHSLPWPDCPDSGSSTAPLCRLNEEELSWVIRLLRLLVVGLRNRGYKGRGLLVLIGNNKGYIYVFTIHVSFYTARYPLRDHNPKPINLTSRAHSLHQYQTPSTPPTPPKGTSSLHCVLHTLLVTYLPPNSMLNIPPYGTRISWINFPGAVQVLIDPPSSM